MFLCRFVWKAACIELKYQGTLGVSLEHKAKAWCTERSVCLYSAFPSLFSYGIWWARNTVIFNNKSIPPQVTTTIVVQWNMEHRSKEKQPKIIALVPPKINNVVPWDFFDGNPLGGLRGVLYFSEKHKIQANFAPRHCTNNKADLAALHFILNLAINNNITQMQVFGDSKMVVD